MARRGRRQREWLRAAGNRLLPPRRVPSLFPQLAAEAQEAEVFAQVCRHITSRQGHTAKSQRTSASPKQPSYLPLPSTGCLVLRAPSGFLQNSNQMQISAPLETIVVNKEAMMSDSNQQIQAQWEMFHQRLAHQIANEMERALEAAEAFTVQLKEQNRLLTESIPY